MKHLVLLLTAISLIAMIGCNHESEDHRVAEVAMRANEEQVKQNIEAARLQRESTANHRRIVEATEASRQTIRSLEEDLQENRNDINAERKMLDKERRRESVLGPAITTIGPLLIAALPLILCWYLLHGLRTPNEETSGAATELLIQELEFNQSRMLGRGTNVPRLPLTGPQEDSTGE